MICTSCTKINDNSIWHYWDEGAVIDGSNQWIICCKILLLSILSKHVIAKWHQLNVLPSSKRKGCWKGHFHHATRHCLYANNFQDFQSVVNSIFHNFLKLSSNQNVSLNGILLITQHLSMQGEQVIIKQIHKTWYCEAELFITRHYLTRVASRLIANYIFSFIKIVRKCFKSIDTKLSSTCKIWHYFKTFRDRNTKFPQFSRAWNFRTFQTLKKADTIFRTFKEFPRGVATLTFVHICRHTFKKV